MLSGMLMVSGEIWGWTDLTSDSGTFLGSFLSLERAVNVIFILVLGNRKQHLTMKVKVLVVLMVGKKKKKIRDTQNGTLHEKRGKLVT